MRVSHVSFEPVEFNRSRRARSMEKVSREHDANRHVLFRRDPWNFFVDVRVKCTVIPYVYRCMSTFLPVSWDFGLPWFHTSFNGRVRHASALHSGSSSCFASLFSWQHTSKSEVSRHSLIQWFPNFSGEPYPRKKSPAKISLFSAFHSKIRISPSPYSSFAIFLF